MSRHTISRADNIYVGSAYNASFHGALGNTTGIPVSFVTFVDMGTPVVADPNHLISGATAAELPDTETVSYTTADDGTTPFDNADTPTVTTITAASGASAGLSVSVWPLDVPRNITANTTHSTSVVAMTITVKGYDQYFMYMEETITVAATGTSQADAGLKAFAYISQIDITAAANAEANTLNLGVGDVLGLPYACDDLDKIIEIFAGVASTTAGTLVAQDTTSPATATTGDVRGTYNPGSTLDGSSTLSLWMIPAGFDTATAFGVAQFEG